MWQYLFLIFVWPDRDSDEVSLSHNWIGDVDEDLFRNLTEITSIQMANMNLHAIPVSIFNDNTLLSSLGNFLSDTVFFN
jgi:hypothetical protein